MNIESAVDFLVAKDALQLGESQWPGDDGTSDVFSVDWDGLFPPRAARDDNGFILGENWTVPLSIEDERSLIDRLGSGAPIWSEHSLSWDVDAWYQPIHFFGYEWGIYIRESALRSTALLIAAFCDRRSVVGIRPSALWTELNRAAFLMYFYHEHYHHKIECLGFRLHVATGLSVYPDYSKNVYGTTRGTDDHLEEALANADSYRRLARNTPLLARPVLEALRFLLRSRFPHDPPGYRRAVDYLSDHRFSDGQNLLHGQVREGILIPTQDRNEWNLAPGLTKSFVPITGSIWSLVPPGTRSALTGRFIAPVRTCSSADIERIARRFGFERVPGGKGSHVKLAKPGRYPLIVPGDRRDLSVGVTKNLLAGIGGYHLNDLPALLAE